MMDTEQALEEVFVGYNSASVPDQTPYAEELLQKAPNSNRLYASFQSYNKQFVESTNPIVRWNNSQIEATSRLVIDSWDASDKKSGENEKRNKNTALFSWSSSDAYIEARKRELQLQRGEFVAPTPKNTDPQMPKEFVSAGITIIPPSESITNKLTRVVDMEANKFIHSRIQAIKAHHTDQMNKQMHARKIRDHETQLKKLKLKEDEYERQLQALSLEHKNGPGFFNTLFGLSKPVIEEALGSESVDDKGDKRNEKKNKSKRFSFMPRIKRKDTEDASFTDSREETPETADKDSGVLNEEQSPEETKESKGSGSTSEPRKESKKTNAKRTHSSNEKKSESTEKSTNSKTDPSDRKSHPSQKIDPTDKKRTDSNHEIKSSHVRTDSNHEIESSRVRTDSNYDRTDSNYDRTESSHVRTESSHSQPSIPKGAHSAKLPSDLSPQKLTAAPSMDAFAALDHVFGDNASDEFDEFTSSSPTPPTEVKLTRKFIPLGENMLQMNGTTKKSDIHEDLLDIFGGPPAKRANNDVPRGGSVEDLLNLDD